MTSSLDFRQFSVVSVETTPKWTVDSELFDKDFYGDGKGIPASTCKAWCI